ncbi:MAG TPA: hypothetical protein VFX52_10705 [Nocardioidaceae bacterium]|nr:hypothetical protein [Nocardioidaceae bacterium]
MSGMLERRTFVKGAAAAGLLGGAWTVGAAPAAAAVVTVQRAGPAHTVTPTLFGLNGNNIQARLRWDRADLGAAVAGLGPGTLRYPAGTVGNYWDWRSGWFQPNGPWPAQTDGTGAAIAPFDDSLTPYQAALQRTGASAVLMLNMLTTKGRLATSADFSAMLLDQVQMLHAAQAAGITVSRVELGNELYLSGALAGTNGNDYVTVFPSASAYAKQATTWARSVRTAFPSAQIAAVGADATGNSSPRREGWNDAVLAGVSGVSALTLHPYIRVSDASASAQSLLSLPYARVQALKGSELATLSSHGLSAWVTEFNMVDRTSSLTFAGTWTHGLFIAAYAILLAQVPTIAVIELHNVVGDAVAGALFDSTAGFRAPTPATQFLAPTAMGAAYSMVVQAARGATTARSLAFSGGPTLSGGAPALVGLELTGGAHHQAVVANLATSGVTLSLTNLFSGAVGWSRTGADSLTTRVTGPSSLVTASGTATGQLSVPAHTVVRLSQ